MVTAAGRRQLQRVDDPAGLILLLKLEHPSIETIYVVNDTRDWTISGQTWVGLPFRFKLPNSAAGEAPRGQLEVDNIGGALTKELEKLPPSGALQATMRLVSRAAPEVVEVSFTAPLTGVSCTPVQLTAMLGGDDLMRAPAVRVRFDPENSPGLFSG